MKLEELSSKAKWVIILMLVATVPALAGIAVAAFVFEETTPPFVYALPVIWVVLFFVCLINLKSGLIGGIIWGIMSVFIPLVPILQGIKNPIAHALSMPICPFGILSIILSLVIIYLCAKEYAAVRTKQHGPIIRI